MEKHDRKRLHGRPISRWEDNIKTDLRLRESGMDSSGSE
jgi:hypothetical protein